MRNFLLSAWNHKSRTRRRQYILVAVGLVLLHLLQGCAHRLPLNDTLGGFDLPAGGKIALAVSKPVEEGLLTIPATGRLVETGRGAAVGTTLGGVGIFCYYAAPICIPVLASAGAVGGAVYGGVAADSAASWDEHAARFNSALGEAKLDRQIAGQIADYAHAHGYEIDDLASRISSDRTITPSDLLTGGYWALLEVSDISVKLIPAELMVNPARQFIMQAHVRLTRMSGNTILADSIIYDELGTTRPVTEWLGEDATHFYDEVSLATARLSERIVDEMFLEEPLPEDVVPLDFAWEAHVSGPTVIYPKPPDRGRVDTCSQQPTIRWQQIDRNQTTYDLRVWRAVGDRTGVVVYRREHLDDTMHALETPLEPSTDYFFSVRARFRENGRDRATDWSRFTIEPTTVSRIMSMGITSYPLNALRNSLYPFRTLP